MAIGQIAAVSTGYGAVTVAGQSQQNVGDVTASIGSYAVTGAVTGNVSKAIASLAKSWSGQTVTIVQAGVGKQVTDCSVNMAYAMLVVIGAFVVLAVIGHVTNIITGLAVSLQATELPVTVITAGIGIAYSGGDGIYDAAVVATALLIMVGIVVVIDSFGPIADNAAGIAEMAELSGDMRHITNALDAVSNITEAVTMNDPMSYRPALTAAYNARCHRPTSAPSTSWPRPATRSI